MANKRRPLSFPELEPRGRRAILRSAEEVNAEEEALENQDTGNQENKNAGITEYQQAGDQASQSTGMPAAQKPAAGINRTAYTKVTYRLSPEAVEAIDEAKRTLRRTYQIRVSLEEIAEAAIIEAVRDLQENQQTSFLSNKFSGNMKGGKSRRAPG